MPQMAPMNWLILTLIFISIFMSFIVLNFFSWKMNKTKSSKSNYNKLNNQKKNWMW